MDAQIIQDVDSLCLFLKKMSNPAPQPDIMDKPQIQVKRMLA